MQPEVVNILFRGHFRKGVHHPDPVGETLVIRPSTELEGIRHV